MLILKVVEKFGQCIYGSINVRFYIKLTLSDHANIFYIAFAKCLMTFQCNLTVLLVEMTD